MNEKYAEKVKPYFPSAYIYKDNELIIEPKNNIYFRVDNIKSDLEFDCKMLEWVSRSTCKGLSAYWQKWMARGFNSYFRKNWTFEEREKIYTRLGNGVNRSLCLKFINHDFDMSVLEKEEIK